MVQVPQPMHFSGSLFTSPVSRSLSIAPWGTSAGSLPESHASKGQCPDEGSGHRWEGLLADGPPLACRRRVAGLLPAGQP